MTFVLSLFHSSPLLANLLGSFSWLEIVLGVVVLAMGFMIWVLTHHYECHYDGEPPGSLTEMLNAVAGSTQGHPVGGNRVRLIQDAAFFDLLVAEIDQAKRTVNFETYLWADGEAAERIAEGLMRASQRGVTVRLLTDARGSSGFGDESKKRLKDAGCRVLSFRRWKLSNWGKFNLRDHRKVVVIDGRIAFVGGHCVDDHWLKDVGEERQYRDISAKVTGPIVSRIQAAFLENWHEVSDELFTDAATFPEIEPSGEVTTHLAYLRADGCPSSVQILHYLAIAFAKKRIRIQNPYFLPDPQGAKALARAAQRGVDVRIMTPSVEASDTPFVQRAGHFLFQRMLEAGVRIYEYQPTLLHQKIVTIDGEWCALGSSNFDDRSFEINDEITLGIADRATTEELDACFEADLASCEERTLGEWKKRPFWKRAVDGVFYLFNEQF